MPPQQTDLRSEIKHDAAAIGLDRSISLVKAEPSDALPAARHDASIAAQRNALSEKDAAGPPAAAALSVFSLLKRYWRVFQEGRRRQRLRVSLRDLSRRQLMDIGLTPDDIDHIAAHRAVERFRDSTTRLWM